MPLIELRLDIDLPQKANEPRQIQSARATLCIATLATAVTEGEKAVLGKWGSTQ